MRHRPFVPLLSVLIALATSALAEDKAAPPAAPDASPPPAAPASDGGGAMADLAKQLADSQDKLATALHSFSQVTDENSQLKAEAEKNAAEKAALATQLEDAQRAMAALKIEAAVAEQVDALRTQLRQSQNQIADLAGENAELRNRLALAGSAPSSLGQAPNRPGSEPPPQIAPGSVAPAAPVAASAAGPRTYTVAEGDSLSKISRKFYGTPNRWEGIVAANRAAIRKENTITVGMKLIIP